MWFRKIMVQALGVVGTRWAGIAEKARKDLEEAGDFPGPTSDAEDPEDPVLSPPEPTPDPMEAAHTLIRRLESELKNELRKNGEFYKVIETIVIERDRWMGMYREHTSQHQNAQAMYERSLVNARELTYALSKYINSAHEKLGLKPVELPPKWSSLMAPVGLAKEFGERMTKMEQELLKELPITNGLAERDRVAALGDAESASNQADRTTAPNA